MESIPEPKSRFPTFRRVLRAVFSRYTLFGLVVLTTLIGLFYAIENWRGKRAWNKTRQHIEARGESLELRSYIPAPVPEDQNAANTPLIHDWFVNRFETDTNRWPNIFSAAQSMITTPRDRPRGVRHPWDLVAWEEALTRARSGAPNEEPIRWQIRSADEQKRAAPSVLKHLAAYDSALTELHEAFQRPYIRYPVEYRLEDPFSILLPHLAGIKSAVLVLQLRASARLAAGDADGAFEDVNLALKVADSLRDEPFLITCLVRIAAHNIAAQAIWEGLKQQRWTDQQLIAFDNYFHGLDFRADLTRLLGAERAAGLATIELVRKSPDPGALFAAFISGPGGPLGGRTFGEELASLAGRLAPDGWYYFEMANYCDLFDMIRPRLETTKVTPSEVTERNEQMEAMFKSGIARVLQHQVMSALLLPGLGNVERRAATAQTVSHQIIIACALERFRRVHGSHPETLDQLVPKFVDAIPPDVITGEPMNYRRHSDGTFTLYSVGWNEKDDGGTPGKVLFDDKVGDWVW